MVSWRYSRFGAFPPLIIDQPTVVLSLAAVVVAVEEGGQAVEVHVLVRMAQHTRPTGDTPLPYSQSTTGHDWAIKQAPLLRGYAMTTL